MESSVGSMVKGGREEVWEVIQGAFTPSKGIEIIPWDQGSLGGLQAGE